MRKQRPGKGRYREQGITMNLSHLKYFISLADSKHFANTAKSLSIARSTLSLAISNLEQDLGAPLFTKNGSTFLLTPYG